VLAIPIIVMFILRVRLRRRQVATLLFWNQLFEEQPPRAWWRRLRNLVALLFQLAFLGLLVGALVDPLWSWQRRRARQIVYVVDNSSSMSAANEGEVVTRIERARQSARRMIASLRQHDSAAIVTAGGMPRVAIGMTNDSRILHEAIDSIEAADGPTRLADAAELARRLVADDQRREIIVLTDGADDAAEELAKNSEVTVYGYGKETSNIAITTFQVRRSVADANSFQVLVEVTNFGDQTAECRLELELEGNVVDVVPLALEPGEPWRRTLDHSSADGGRLAAKLDITDALPTDNQAIAVLPRRDPIPVLLITPGSLFLKSVFESIPNVQLSITDQVPSEIPPQTIAVIHKTKLETIPADHPCIVVDPISSSDGWTLGETLPEPIVAKQAVDSPLMAHIRLQNVILAGAKELEFTSDVEPLLQGPTDSAMYARLRRSGGDVFVLSVDLDDGDLPLRIAFPVMIKNAIESLLGDKGELRPSIATGHTTTIDLGASSLVAADDAEALAEIVLRSPDGKMDSLTASDGQIHIGPFDRAGLWLLGPRSALAESSPDVTGDRIVPIAVNLANPAESDLRPRAELMAPPHVSIAWGGHSMWFYLSLLAIVGVSVEWFLYQRRMIG
jgi:hypothetical protein